MKKAKLLFIIWGVIVVIIVGLFTAMGFILESKAKDYEKYENKMVEAAKDYVFDNILLESDDELIIKLNELIEGSYIDTNTVNNDVCEGYVIIKSNGDISYQAFIKCKNYQTLNYRKK